jgi:DNA-binding NarL/FixJ family response regulator
MRRVLVVGNQRLLGAGIERLLRREADLQIVGITLENQGELSWEIGSCHADVVVLDESMADPNKLIALLKDHPGLRVLIVRAEDGLVRVYETQQVFVTQATELVALIKS